ncbi:MAG TPA: flagellar hook-basal body complex protein FliE [Azospirillaceae bacterium]|nr:flagellar hook-basal body complex protein FliE [Azospirillaceae bacterium]
MVSISNAISAYSAVSNGVTGTVPPAVKAKAAGPSFAEMVGDAAQDAIETTREAEQMTVRAALGRADMTDVVTAVSAAEVTMQAVVAVRDKVVSAYQEILRMQI